MKPNAAVALLPLSGLAHATLPHVYPWGLTHTVMSAPKPMNESQDEQSASLLAMKPIRILICVPGELCTLNPSLLQLYCKDDCLINDRQELSPKAVAL